MVEKNDTSGAKNVSLFEFGLIVPAVLKCLFRHNFCGRGLPHIYSFLFQSKILLMYIM